jgi:hypothetical protein
MNNFLNFFIFNELLQITIMLQNPNFYVFGYIWIHVLDGGIFHFFKKSMFGGTNTMCCIKLFVETFNVMAKVQ